MAWNYLGCWIKMTKIEIAVWYDGKLCFFKKQYNYLLLSQRVEFWQRILQFIDKITCATKTLKTHVLATIHKEKITVELLISTF